MGEGLRERQRTERQDLIVETAEVLLAESGYQGWTLADLADRAGISRRALYHHFPSKEAIAAETLARNLRAQTGELVQLAADATPGNRLRAAVGWFLERRSSPGAGTVRMLKAEPGLQAAARAFPVYQQARQGFQAALARLVGQAQDAREITTVWGAEDLAALLVELLRGVDVEAWTPTHPEAAREVTELLFAGLGTGDGR